MVVRYNQPAARDATAPGTAATARGGRAQDAAATVLPGAAPLQMGACSTSLPGGAQTSSRGVNWSFAELSTAHGRGATHCKHLLARSPSACLLLIMEDTGYHPKRA